MRQLAPQMRMVLLRQQQQHFASRLPSLPCLVSTALLLACDHAAGNGGDTDGADVAAAAAGSSERHHGSSSSSASSAIRTDDAGDDTLPSCDWTLEPRRSDYRVLSASNGAPTAWEFGGNGGHVIVSRTYHSGLGHPCWDQTLRFESTDGRAAMNSVPLAVVAAVVISGGTEAVLGGSGGEIAGELADDDQRRLHWTLADGRAPDASQGSSATSTSSSRIGGSKRLTYWLRCLGSTEHAVATVTTEQVLMDDHSAAPAAAAAWTMRVRLVRTCPDVWSHMAVNVSPPPGVSAVGTIAHDPQSDAATSTEGRNTQHELL
eukprot:COSAG01_NODE_3377_length_6172_cov_134.808003_2_plen_318_part_00